MALVPLLALLLALVLSLVLRVLIPFSSPINLHLKPRYGRSNKWRDENRTRDGENRSFDFTGCGIRYFATKWLKMLDF